MTYRHNDRDLEFEKFLSADWDIDFDGEWDFDTDTDYDTDVDIDGDVDVDGNATTLTWDVEAVGENTLIEASIAMLTLDNLSSMSGAISASVEG